MNGLKIQKPNEFKAKLLQGKFKGIHGSAHRPARPGQRRVRLSPAPGHRQVIEKIFLLYLGRGQERSALDDLVLHDGNGDREFRRRHPRELQVAIEISIDKDRNPVDKSSTYDFFTPQTKSSVLLSTSYSFCFLG